MKYLNGENHVEVKDHRYRIHPTENNNLRKRDPQTSIRTQYQVQNDTQIRKNQKIVETNGKLEVKDYPKNKQKVLQQLKFKPSDCPNCKQNSWSKFDKGYYCQNFEYSFKKQKHEID